MELNPQQRLIVSHPLASSALVMAGAGSGKTTVIAQRALQLIPQLEVGQHLQMLTFSNKAAKEMKERVARIGGRDSMDLIRFDTFHSFGLKLIKANPEGYGLIPDFSLLNENDCKRSLRMLARDNGLPKQLEGIDRKRLNPVSWFSTWSLARQAGFDVNNPKNKAELCNRLARSHDLDAVETELAWKTLSLYEEQKRSANAVDFDDLLYLPLLRVAKDEAYRQVVREGLGYVVIDEAQDTNRIQYELVRYIAQGYCGVTCVGDDDQSIYGWRGAEVTNLKRFVSHFHAAELRLEQNYRSTQAIVECAGELIRNNQERLEKSPFSKGEVGEKPSLVMSEDHRAMADEIARSIAQGLADGIPASEFAVLYRTNRMAMLIEQGLRRYKVPYHVVGGMSLFDRSEVVAVTSALRLASNPTDVYALKSIQPFIDGFGQASCYALCDWLSDEFGASLNDLPDQIPNLPQRGLAAFQAFYEDLRSEAVFSEDAASFINWVIEGPMAVLEREKDDQIRERKAQHLAALGNDIQSELAERSALEAGLTWRSLMLEVALRDARQSEATDQQVTLSTVHRSKGLEWDWVYLAGFSEGLMPLDSKTELEDSDAACGHIEEERRLAYVGLTRARQGCFLHHADSYGFPGSREDRVYEPSRFIEEMGLEACRPVASEQLDTGESFDFEEFKSEFLGLARGMM
ncbi:ATP-dependent helicase [Stutzerimonas stutzeri]|uniref:ATP-dependent helicase n=1 Tax=Stutzerimonas stutzeri TaxID=316 RepID=UPI00265C9CD2|nr:ATP-dependent helicase [Stutzerimonas stutzeri]MCF6783423.1 ATP-dependent helicase [Stutzerimonas stutzeri]